MNVHFVIESNCQSSSKYILKIQNRQDTLIFLLQFVFQNPHLRYYS